MVVSVFLTLLSVFTTTSAFTVGPSKHFGIASQHISCSFFGKAHSLCLRESKRPFFANMGQKKEKISKEDAEEIDRIVKEEMKNKKKISNLRNENGVDYAPWMNISEDDEKKIRQVVTEKTAARRIRQEQERSVSGNLYSDSQAQELSGTGLKAKIIDENIELEWATKAEKDCKGFVVRRRPAKTEEFSVLATYNEFAPLVSQGVDGGIYRYFDETAGPGGWVYRISEATTSGEESDICQCLVEVQTADERKAGLIAGIGISVLALAVIAAGILLDPVNGF